MNLKKVLAMMLAVTLSLGSVTVVQANEKNDKTEELTIDTIEEKIENMSTEEKVGQTLMIQTTVWNGEGVWGECKDIEDLISKYNIGGTILFGYNFNQGSKEVVKLTDGLQKAANIPLLISIDQEGGGCTRIEDGTRMPGNMAMSAIQDEKIVDDTFQAMGREVKAVGANVNLGPVCEISSEPISTIVGLRSFGSDKNKVAQMAEAYIKAMHKSDVMVAAKHFPGQGATSGDTHFGLTVINQDINTLKNETLVPFKESIYENVDMIMPTHAVFPALDDDKIIVKNDDGEEKEIPTPATFSKKILTDLLRDEIGFDGVVISDALDMAALHDGLSDEEIAIKALNAGCDILLMPYPVAGTDPYGNDTVVEFDKYFKGIVDAVDKGEIKEERIDEAVRRILTLKVKNKLYEDNKISLEEKLKNVDKIVGCNENKEIERNAAEKAVTLVKNDNSMLPMKLEDNKKVVIYDYAQAYEDEDGKEQIATTLSADRIKEAVEKIAKEDGIKNLDVQIAPIDLKLTIIDYNTFENTAEFNRSIDDMCKDMDDADYVIIAPYMQAADYTAGPTPWSAPCKTLPDYNTVPEKLIEYANKNNKNYVSLNVREPYGIAYMNNSKAIVSIYANLGGDMVSGSSPDLRLANVEAGIRTIFGYNKPQGKLPVDIKKTKDGKVEYPVGHGLSYN